MPRSIAAVTFTEFAASELFIRVKAFVDALAGGDIPAELRVALPHGLSDAERRCLGRGAGRHRRHDVLDHPRFLPAPDHAVPGGSRHRPRRGRHGSATRRTWRSPTWSIPGCAASWPGPPAACSRSWSCTTPRRPWTWSTTLLDHLRRHTRAGRRIETGDLEALAAAFRAAVDGFWRVPARRRGGRSRHRRHRGTVSRTGRRDRGPRYRRGRRPASSRRWRRSRTRSWSPGAAVSEAIAS